MYDIYDLPKSIPLGRQGEQYARAVEIDCAKMLRDYPGARLTLMQRRTRGETARIVKADVSDTGVITWSPDMDAMAVAGLGAIEIVATVDDKVAKSVIAATAIAPSLTPPDTDTQSGWVKDVLDASDAAQGAMAAAQESAAAAAGSAAAAQSSANAAAGSASAAAQSAASAAQSADAASGSASAAAQSAAEADTSAKASAASAAEAAGTLDSVKASADAAAGSARAAAESASDAADSKSSAAQSATDAAQAASAAAGSASQSAAARDVAQAAATAAGAAASDAADSATAAAGSKDAAAQSASAAAASAAKAEKAAQDAAGIIDDTVIAEDKAWSSKHTVDKFLPMQTVTGNPAVIETLEGYPMSIKANWKPMQEGEGEPYPAGSSKNVLSLDTWVDRTTNGITFKREGNGIHVSGTATGAATSVTIPMQNLEPGKYYGWKTKGELTQQLVIKSAATSTNSWQIINEKAYAIVKEGDEGKYWYLNVAEGTTIDYIIYPQIYKSDTAPTQFWPYSNVRQIKGRESVRVTRKNKTQENGKTLTLPTTIYGGEVDAVTGAGNANIKVTTIDGDKIKFTESGLYWNLPFNSAPNAGSEAAYATSHFSTKLIKINKTYAFAYATAKEMKPYFATVEKFNTYLSAQYVARTPMQIAYKLAAPEIFSATGGGRIDALAGTNTISTDADTVTITAPTPPQTTASAAEAQAAKLDYVAMMADVDMDDLLAADDADADSGMMYMPTDIEWSETDGEQEI